VTGLLRGNCRGRNRAALPRGIPTIEPVHRVDLIVLGPRNYPLATARIPARHVSDFPDLLKGARALNPFTTPEDVIRAIWRLGSRRLWMNIRHRIPIRDGDLPGPKPLSDGAAEVSAVTRRNDGTPSPITPPGS